MSFAYNLCGWESLIHTVEQQMVQDADWIYAFVHWFLVYKEDFGCLGTTRSEMESLFVDLSGDAKLTYEDTSELLPDGWLQSYSLRYMYEYHPDTVYSVRARIFDDTIHFTLLNAVTQQRLSGVQFVIAEAAGAIRAAAGAKWTTSELTQMIECSMAELLHPVFGRRTQTVETQTAIEPVDTNRHTIRLGCDQREFCRVSCDRWPPITRIEPIQLGSRGVPEMVEAGDRLEEIGQPPIEIVYHQCKGC